jgi:hypothetical protein
MAIIISQEIAVVTLITSEFSGDFSCFAAYPAPAN